MVRNRSERYFLRPPDTEKYEALKKQLTQRVAASQEQKATTIGTRGNWRPKTVTVPMTPAKSCGKRRCRQPVQDIMGTTLTGSRASYFNCTRRQKTGRDGATLADGIIDAMSYPVLSRRI